MRNYHLETVTALADLVDAKQQQVEKLAEAMLALANNFEQDLGGDGIEAAQRIRDTVKEALGA